MTQSRHGWRKWLPDLPVRRYTVHAGTNTREEWFQTLPWLLDPWRDQDAVRTFEEQAAVVAGCRHAVAFGAGRMALYALLEAFDFQPGDEIIIPGFTCTVVPNAMLYRGLKPVYADIEDVTFNVRPDAVEAAITPRTRAIYLQHTFGTTCDVNRLKAIAGRHGLATIEDAAHSIGAGYQGQPHGSLGDAGFFSSDRTKVVNTHLGGCAVTNDDRIARRLRAMQAAAPELGKAAARRLVFSFLAEVVCRDPYLLWLGRPILGALRRIGALYTWVDEPWVKLPTGYPYPSRMLPALACVGASQLAHIESNLAHRRSLAHWLETRIGWYANVLGSGFDEQSWLRYSFLIEDQAGFVARFGKRIDLGLWFTHNIFGRQEDPDAVGYVAGSCPVAERVSRHIVNFPTHSRLPLGFLEQLWELHGDWLAGQVMLPVAFKKSTGQPSDQTMC